MYVSFNLLRTEYITPGYFTFLRNISSNKFLTKKHAINKNESIIIDTPAFPILNVIIKEKKHRNKPKMPTEFKLSIIRIAVFVFMNIIVETPLLIQYTLIFRFIPAQSKDS